jgi:hypothetical protein
MAGEIGICRIMQTINRNFQQRQAWHPSVFGNETSNSTGTAAVVHGSLRPVHACMNRASSCAQNSVTTHFVCQCCQLAPAHMGHAHCVHVKNKRASAVALICVPTCLLCMHAHVHTFILAGSATL